MIFSLSPTDTFLDPVVLEVVADEFLIGGGVGGDLGLESILCILIVGLGDFERLSWALIVCSNKARFRDMNGEIFRFSFSADGLRERQASVASVRYV